MVGLDAAGKTTILYKLKLGEIVTTIPTIGMDIYIYHSTVIIVKKPYFRLLWEDCKLLVISHCY